MSPALSFAHQDTQEIQPALNMKTGQRKNRAQFTTEARHIKSHLVNTLQALPSIIILIVVLLGWAVSSKY